MSFTRITVRADQMDGVPCIRGLRIPVSTVVGMVADGMNDAEILAAYPDLEAEDIREAVRYAAEAVRERELPLAASAWRSDPFARGSYSYALPGHADDRARLAAPVDDRLFFAGEACSPDFFSTAHGAYETGTAAAEAALASRAG